MVSVRAAFLIFALFEIRKDVVPAPALTSAVTPAVKIFRLTTHVDHAVDCTGAAHNLTPRLEQPAAIEVWFWFTDKAPVHLGIVVKHGITKRHMNEWTAI